MEEMIDTDEPLFQETLRSEPFWMLVACILARQTSWAAAAPVFAKLRTKFSSPLKLAQASAAAVSALVEPLGLMSRRAFAIRDLARAWAVKPFQTGDEVEAIAFLGKYGGNSWRIFVEGDFDVEVADADLRRYLEQRGSK